MFRTVLANQVLITIFELGSKVSKSVNTETFGGVSVMTSLWMGVGFLSHRIVTTETQYHCFGSDIFVFFYPI